MDLTQAKFFSVDFTQGCQTQGTWNWAMADASSFSWGNDGTNLQLTMTHDDGQTMR